MLATFQNSGFVLSIGIFFSLMIIGLSSTLPTSLTRGLMSQGVPAALAHEVGQTPPVASLFATFLGYNPVRQLLAPTGVLTHLPARNVATLTGKQFFPYLIAGPFHHGLVIVFSMAIIVLIIAAGASLLRGGRYVYDEDAPGQDSAAPGNTMAGNTVTGNTEAEDLGPLADTALGASPDLAIEVAAEVADEAARDSRR